MFSFPLVENVQATFVRKGVFFLTRAEIQGTGVEEFLGRVPDFVLQGKWVVDVYPSIIDPMFLNNCTHYRGLKGAGFQYFPIVCKSVDDKSYSLPPAPQNHGRDFERQRQLWGQRLDASLSELNRQSKAL